MTSPSSIPSILDDIPEIYRSHPSRPVASTVPTTSEHRQRVDPHIGVVVALLSPICTEDAVKIQHLQKVREQWDQAYPKWLPHVTLIPPFNIPPSSGGGGRALIPEAPEGSSIQTKDLSPARTDTPSNRSPTSKYRRPTAVPIDQLKESLCTISSTISQTCGAFPAHTLTLNDVGTFKLREYTNVHLRPRPLPPAAQENGPRPETESVQLQKALADAFAQEGYLGKRQKNRTARRRRESVASTNDLPELASQEITTTFAAHDAGASTTRTYSRPRYRSGAVDEARFVTLPIVEIEQETVSKEPVLVMNSTPGGDRAIVHDEARNGTMSGTRLSRGTGGKRDDALGPTSSTTHYTKQGSSAHQRQFNPHASVGQARSPRECRELIALAKSLSKGESAGASRGQDAHRGIDCLIDKVYFLTKPIGNGGPYELYSVAHLRREAGGDS
ncbi:hypothetical protein NCC49_002965 [Naganishia albida]|nr:hypothetical protein NCC49_002965 [Naganishia albida]